MKELHQLLEQYKDHYGEYPNPETVRFTKWLLIRHMFSAMSYDTADLDETLSLILFTMSIAEQTINSSVH
jgi:hypothetical protein